jgi:hypothetical protein
MKADRKLRVWIVATHRHDALQAAPKRCVMRPAAMREACAGAAASQMIVQVCGNACTDLA